LGHIVVSLQHWMQQTLVSCNKRHWQHALFSSICKALSSALHAAQSGGVQLGAWYTPLEAYALLIIFCETVFGYVHKLQL